MTGELFSELRENLRSVILELDHVFLDPNNPRFSRDYDKIVPDSRIMDEKVQQKALDKMEKQGLDDLIENIIEVGFLPIDRIVVRKIASTDNYVVVEGNRRISALKKIKMAYDTGELVLEESILSTIVKFHALEYIGSDSMISWVIQGLRHISGVRDWEAYQKGKFVYELNRKEGRSLSEIGRMIGVSSQKAGIWYRAYAAYMYLKNNTNGAQRITPEIFPYLQELFSRGCLSLKDWLGWNEETEEFDRNDHVQEFISWRFPENDDIQMITQAIELRKIAKLRSEAPEIFDQFRDGSLSLEQAISRKIEIEARQRASEEESLDTHLHRINDLIRKLEHIPLLEAIERRSDVIEAFQKVIDTARKIIDKLETIGK